MAAGPRSTSASAPSAASAPPSGILGRETFASRIAWTGGWPHPADPIEPPLSPAVTEEVTPSGPLPPSWVGAGRWPGRALRQTGDAWLLTAGGQERARTRRLHRTRTARRPLRLHRGRGRLHRPRDRHLLLRRRARPPLIRLHRRRRSRRTDLIGAGHPPLTACGSRSTIRSNRFADSLDHAQQPGFRGGTTTSCQSAESIRQCLGHQSAQSLAGDCDLSCVGPRLPQGATHDDDHPTTAHQTISAGPGRDAHRHLPHGRSGAGTGRGRSHQRRLRWSERRRADLPRVRLDLRHDGERIGTGGPLLPRREVPVHAGRRRAARLARRLGVGLLRPQVERDAGPGPPDDRAWRPVHHPAARPVGSRRIPDLALPR